MYYLTFQRNKKFLKPTNLKNRPNVNLILFSQITLLEIISKHCILPHSLY